MWDRIAVGAGREASPPLGGSGGWERGRVGALVMNKAALAKLSCIVYIPIA